MNSNSPPEPGSGIEHFLAELRRRNVVRVALAYLAFAWLTIQLFSEVGPILGFAEWFPRLMLGLLALGFLISLVLAWVYELTNKGIRTTEEVDADTSLKRVNPHILNYLIIGALALALGYFVWEARFADSVRSRSQEAIAVLPFRDLSQQGNQQYFADGVAEELINALSRIAGLKVAGRMSSFARRDHQGHPPVPGSPIAAR
jgi:hypothetical protein